MEMFSILPDDSVAQPPDTKVGNIRIKQVNIVIIIIIFVITIIIIIFVIILRIVMTMTIFMMKPNQESLRTQRSDSQNAPTAPMTTVFTDAGF